jgi:DnaJ like chaperone protein
VLGNEEEKLLRQIGSALGITSTFFDQLIRMAHAQSHFRGYGGEQTFSAASRQDEIALAYQALGIDDSATDAEIKKAYRKLMSENHPDKLMGQGLPEDMIALATERSQEIQTAYELIKKARNG